jgi:beta subunit of N-acylethanolamine-hydrolyzing acid amidase
MAPDLQPEPEVIPTYRIDLSLPPSERYLQVATDFAPRMRSITPLFDKVLATAIPWAWLRGFIQSLAFIFLRRVYSAEETEELKGISKASGVEMYFLVALNVLLDGLLGCTSGGVMVRYGKRKGKISAEGQDEESKMVHFRTLDWGMDELRSVLVVLEFVRSKSKDPGKVIARSITYAGFVGVLTGVRRVSKFCGPIIVICSSDTGRIYPYLSTSDLHTAARPLPFDGTKFLSSLVTGLR